MKPKKEYRVNARLSADVAEQLKVIVKTTGSTMSDVISDLISRYYGEVIPERTNAIKILKKHGLVGCMKADPNLSRDYKDVLTDILDKKYDPR